MPGIGIGIGLPFVGGGLNAYVSAFVARVNAEGGSLTANEISYLNTFANSVDLSEFDRLWIHGLSNQVAARVSLVNAATADLITEVNAPTWTANQGYTGNGTTQYLNANINLSTETSKYQLDSSCIGVYSRTNLSGSSNESIGASVGAAITTLYIREAGNLSYFYLNNDVATLGKTNTNSQGLFSALRTASTGFSYYKNGLSYGTDTVTSTSKPNADLYILARNNNGSAVGFDTKQISLSFLGSGAINQATFYTAVQNLGTSLGWAV